MLIDPGGAATPGHNGVTHAAFAYQHSLGLRDNFNYVAHSHTPCNRCLRFRRLVTKVARKTHSQPAGYALAGRDSHPQDDADFAQRTPVLK